MQYCMWYCQFIFSWTVKKFDEISLMPCDSIGVYQEMLVQNAKHMFEVV